MTEPFSDFIAPAPSGDAITLMPPQVGNFPADLMSVIVAAFSKVQPDMVDAVRICLTLILCAVLLGLFRSLPGKMNEIVSIAGAVMPGMILLSNTRSMVQLATSTVTEMSQYGKLLLPVLTATLAGQGGGGTSAALYTMTMVADSIFCSFLTKLLIPLVYTFLLLQICFAVTKDIMMGSLSKQISGIVSWIMKISLTAYTALLSVTGVITGTTDAAALKATKLTLSNVVPLVGGILSDASEAVLVGAGVVKNTAGVYGLLSLLAILVTPFLKIGIQYLMLKGTTVVCQILDDGAVSQIISAFTTAMGILLALVGSMAIIFAISIICFLKGMGG